MRRQAAPAPKPKLPSPGEKFQPTKLHEKTVKAKKEQGSIFKPTIVDIKPITQRGIFQESLKTVSDHITDNLQPGQQPEQEKQWILNLNDIVNGQKNWDDDPAAANAFAYSYLAIMSGEIQVDGIDPLKLLKPEDSKKRINLLKGYQQQGFLETLTPEELAQKTQEQLKTEFKIAQLALLPKEQFHFLEGINKGKQSLDQSIINRLIKKGAKSHELLDELGIGGLNINRALLSTLEQRQAAQINEYYQAPNQVEFRQLIHQLAAGSIAEHSHLQLPEGVTNIDDLDLPENIKVAASADNRAEIIRNAFANREKLKTIPEADIYENLRESIHKDVTSSDFSDLDVLTDLAAINPDFQKKLADKITTLTKIDLGNNPTIEHIKDKLSELNSTQITKLTNHCQKITCDAIKNGPWDQPVDLALTFFERKVDQALSLESVVLEQNNLTATFFQDLKPNQIAPIIVSGKFTQQELLDEGVPQETIKQTFKEFIYYNEEEELLEIKTIISQDELDAKIAEAENKDLLEQKAFKLIADEINEQDPYLQQTCKQVIKQFAQQSAQDLTPTQLKQIIDSHPAQGVGPNRTTLTANQAKTIHQNQVVSQFVDQETGMILKTNPVAYNTFMQQARLLQAQTSPDLHVQQVSKEIKDEAIKEIEARYMTQETADKIDPSYLAALQKLGKLKPEVVENASPAQKQTVENLIKSSDPEHLNLPSGYTNYSTTDWAIFFQLFPQIAQQVFTSLSEDQQQQIKNNLFA